MYILYMIDGGVMCLFMFLFLQGFCNPLIGVFYSTTFLASVDSCYLLITFAKCLDPEHNTTFCQGLHHFL